MIPIESMYGIYIYTYSYHNKSQPNVGKIPYMDPSRDSEIFPILHFPNAWAISIGSWAPLWSSKAHQSKHTHTHPTSNHQRNKQYHQTTAPPLGSPGILREEWENCQFSNRNFASKNRQKLRYQSAAGLAFVETHAFGEDLEVAVTDGIHDLDQWMGPRLERPKMMVTPTEFASFSTDIHVRCCFAGEIAPAKMMLGRVLINLHFWLGPIFFRTRHTWQFFATTMCGRIIHNLEIPLSIPYQKVALARHHGSKQNCKFWVLMVQSAFSGHVLNFFCWDCHPNGDRSDF